MSDTKVKNTLELKNIHAELQPVYDYIGKMHESVAQNTVGSFQTMYRMNKKYCAVMMRALPTLQKYAKQFEYNAICDELIKQTRAVALATLNSNEGTIMSVSPSAQPGYILFEMIGEFRQSRYIDDKFNTSVQKYSLAFPDIDEPNFGIKSTTDKETIERYRTMLDRSWTDEGFIDIDGNFYYVGSDHLLTLNWLDANKVSTMNFIRIANPNNGYFFITNGKDEKNAIQLTRKQAKALVTLYRIMQLKRQNMKPLSASLFKKSENLGFDNPKHIASGMKNAQTISAYASSEEFDYEAVQEALREVKATGQSPVLRDFRIR